MALGRLVAGGRHMVEVLWSVILMVISSMNRHEEILRDKTP